MRTMSGSEEERTNAGQASTADRKNLLLIVNLRWLIIAGQTGAILVADLALQIALPLAGMAGVIVLLIALNIASLLRIRTRHAPTSNELLAQLLLDILGLTAQLHLSGGAANPFVSLYLIPVIIGAVLLKPGKAWILVTASGLAFLALGRWFRPIEIHAHGGDFFPLHLQGMFLCFLFVAVLIVLLVTHIRRNLAERDANLVRLHDQSVEEDHVVRLGLLASGAAHELGTPLSTLSVIVGDWGRMPQIAGNRDRRAELAEMETEIARCKDIVSGILLLSGQARGEDAAPTRLTTFLDAVIADWRARRSPADFIFEHRIRCDLLIASDLVFKQMLHNVLDNALEASPCWVRAEADGGEEELSVRVYDRGPGFSETILANFGRPYRSTKDRGGLGLFLVVNVARKLGGRAFAHNGTNGGATIEIRLPLASLAVT